MARIAASGFAAMAAALLGAPVVTAQPPAVRAKDSPVMYCVYSRLAQWDTDRVVAQVFLSDETPEADIGRAGQLVERAVKACSAEHELTGGQQAAMRDIGMYGAALDFLAGRLADLHASGAAISGVFDVFNGLVQSDRDRLFQDNWRSSLAFNQKLADVLVAGGVPDDELAIELAFQMLEISAMSEQNVTLFGLGERAGG